MEVCPVVSEYLASLRKLVDFDTALNESYAVRVDDLSERAVDLAATRATSHQRAFYGMEHLIYLALPRLQQGAAVAQQSPERWERSSDGITSVISWLQALMGDAVCLEMECQIARRVVAGVALGAGQLRQSYCYSLQQFGDYFIRGAVTLRRSLGNPQTRLARIGSSFARAAFQAKYSVPDLLRFAEELSTQSEENVTHLCPRRTK